MDILKPAVPNLAPFSNTIIRPHNIANTTYINKKWLHRRLNTSVAMREKKNMWGCINDLPYFISIKFWILKGKTYGPLKCSTKMLSQFIQPCGSNIVFFFL